MRPGAPGTCIFTYVPPFGGVVAGGPTSRRPLTYIQQAARRRKQALRIVCCEAGLGMSSTPKWTAHPPQAPHACSHQPTSAKPPNILTAASSLRYTVADRAAPSQNPPAGRPQTIENSQRDPCQTFQGRACPWDAVRRAWRPSWVRVGSDWAQRFVVLDRTHAGPITGPNSDDTVKPLRALKHGPIVCLDQRTKVLRSWNHHVIKRGLDWTSARAQKKQARWRA